MADWWSWTAEQLVMIVSDPEVLEGRMRIRGTRIPVSVVLDCLAGGMTEDEIVQKYPPLTVAGVRAAAAYGAMLARDELVPLAGHE